jgi:hypothetical protein
LPQQIGGRAAVLWPAALQPLERWGAGLIEGDDLAVERNPSITDGGR